MKNKMLDDSNQIYKELYDTGKDRFKSLPYWHRSYSNWLKKENDNKINKTYNSYKRGTIIYIDFGVNVGSEVSGGHFAIVISKKDNRKSNTLNVIPLSSKNKRFYLPIDQTVFENASNVLQQYLEELRQKTEKRKCELEQVQEQLIEINKELTNDTMAISKDKIRELEDKLDGIKIIIMEHQKVIGEDENDQKMIEQVQRKYSNYNKETYACYKSIQTISKLKIRKINKFDPSGKMRVNNNTLDELDKKILTEYTNFKLSD